MIGHQAWTVNQRFTLIVQASEKIREILVGMSQRALAARIGLTQGSVSQLAAGETTPVAVTCLALAGVDVAHTDYWHEQSGLAAASLESIQAGFKIPVQSDRLSGDERALLDWWRTPNDPMEAAMKTAIEKLLDLRTK